MGEDNNRVFSEQQRDKIYRDMLMPLKTKISQILLYDSDAAMEFLKTYNAIVKNEESLGIDILKEITELEFQINKYEKTQGKDKISEEQGRIIWQKIEDLLAHFAQLSTQEIEQEMANMRNSLGNFKYEDRDKIERRIYAIKVKLIEREIQNGTTDLKEIIHPEDEQGIVIAINDEINVLAQSKDNRIQEIAVQLKGKMMDGIKAVYNFDLWRQLNVAKNGIELSSKIGDFNTTNNTSLVVPTVRKSFLETIKRKFKKEPTLPLQLDEVPKVTLDWLTKQVPASMLQKIEDDRLEKEGKNPTERYIPDARYPIYEALKNTSYNDYVDGNYNMEGSYYFTDAQGIKKCLNIDGTDIMISNEVGEEIEIGMRYSYHTFTLFSSLEYMSMLDDILGTRLLQELLLQAEKVIEKASARKDRDYIQDSIFYLQKDATFKKISKAREKMREEISSYKNFKALEERRREQFYETHNQDRFKQKYKVLELPQESEGKVQMDERRLEKLEQDVEQE